MDEKRIVRISKFFSKHLRHAPREIGLMLQPGGWVAVDDLLAAATRHGFPVTRAELDVVVTTNDKQRFTFDETGTRIRANQGHSVEVDLELTAADPPELLYHGTAAVSLDAILSGGLLRMRRHHVHLSKDIATALKVGGRHGKPVVLAVAANKMTADGFRFFVSANGVWLVDHVPPSYVTVLSPESLV